VLGGDGVLKSYPAQTFFHENVTFLGLFRPNLRRNVGPLPPNHKRNSRMVVPVKHLGPHIVLNVPVGEIILRSDCIDVSQLNVCQQITGTLKKKFNIFI